MGDPTVELAAALGAALDQGIVPSAVRSQLGALTDRIEQIKHDRLLAAPAVERASRLAIFSPRCQRRSARSSGAPWPLRRSAYASAIGSLPTRSPAYPASTATPPPSHGRCGWRTRGHLPLVRELQDVASLAGANAETAAFDLRPFAHLEAVGWREILERRQPKTGGTLGDDDERLDNYAASLARYVEDALPTAVITSRIASDDGIDSPFRSTKFDLTSFFESNPSFELGVAPLALYLQDGRDEKLSNAELERGSRCRNTVALLESRVSMPSSA